MAKKKSRNVSRKKNNFTLLNIVLFILLVLAILWICSYYSLEKSSSLKGELGTLGPGGIGSENAMLPGKCVCDGDNIVCFGEVVKDCHEYTYDLNPPPGEKYPVTCTCYQWSGANSGNPYCGSPGGGALSCGIRVSSPAYPSCTADSDCNSREVCVSDSDLGCYNVGVCEECGRDSDCPSGKVCVGCRCETPDNGL
ncbi:MAG: hypothetical protein RL557_1029 [archaeon]